MSLLTLFAGAALAAGGTVFNVSVTESVTVADTQSAQAVFAPAISESVSAVDSQTGNAVFVVAQAEVGTAADTQTGMATFVVALTETGSASDSSTGLATFAAALTESLTASDSEDATVSSGSGVIYNDSVTEVLSSADTAVASVDFVVSVSESGTVAETIVGDVLSTPLPFVPELGAGSGGGSGGGMDAYASMRWAEYDRRKGRKPIEQIVAPVKQPTSPAKAIVAPPRRVVTVLEPVDLDEHDRALERLTASIPEALEEPAPSLVVVEPVPSGYTQAAFDALQQRKSTARRHIESDASQRQAIFDRLADRIEPASVREVRTERARTNLFKKHERQAAPVPVSPVAMATRVAEAHRKEVREAEERAWKIYGYLFQSDHQSQPKSGASE